MYLDKKELVAFLRNDLVKNINMVYFAEKNGIINAEKFDNTVIMRGCSDRVWTFISSPDKTEFLHNMNRLTEDDINFAVIEDWMKPLIIQNRRIEWDFSTIRLYLPDDVEADFSPSDDLGALNPVDAEEIFLNSHFNEYTPIAYIKSCIESGPSVGIRKDGKLVAWGMTHDDSAIGFLHVIDEFRKQGLAEKIMRFMIFITRKQGRVPFVHIEESNEISLNLALKLGFKKDRKVHWFEIEK